MDEWHPRTDPDEEEAVRRLLEMAGPRPPIPQEDLDAISAATRSAWQTQVRRRVPARRPLRAFAVGLAAALAVAVGLALWWAAHRPSPTVAWVEEVAGPIYLESRAVSEGAPIPLGAAIRSVGRASLRLSDGATVRLDLESRLRFVSAAVLELERGGLYVDTGRGPRSIEVRTSLGRVQDIGTQFALRVSGTALVVRVRDGAVRTEHRGRTWLTQAGQELVLRRDGRSEIRAVASYGPEWEWVLETSPGFDIEGRSLQELLDWVSRETGWRIVLDERLADSASRIVLHGSLGELRPDQAPFAVLPGAGLEGELEDGTLTVRPRSPR
jgi:ferric-dicitrate binding protein FerR (iron transport regulator)